MFRLSFIGRTIFSIMDMLGECQPKNILEFVEKLQEENTKKEKIFKPKTPEEQAAFFKAHGIKG